MCEYLSLAPDFALTIFAGIGLFFTYRAWRQREDDLHEKYFERRFELFKSITDAIGEALIPKGADYQWFTKLSGKKERVGFLFGAAAEEKFSELFELLIEYQGALEIKETAERVNEAKKIRQLSTEKAGDLRRIMAKKIHVSR